MYLRQTANALTGEYTCVMLKPLRSDDLDTACSEGWLDTYWHGERSVDRPRVCRLSVSRSRVPDLFFLVFPLLVDFQRRLISLLGYAFTSLRPSLALSILHRADGVIAGGTTDDEAQDGGASFDHPATTETLAAWDLTSFDLKRLESYAKNLVDHHAITDLLPQLARRWFLQRPRDRLSLSPLQAAILLALGLQHRTVDALATDLDLPASQILALFNKLVRKFAQHLRHTEELRVERGLSMSAEAASRAVAQSSEHMQPIGERLEDELSADGAAAADELDCKHRTLVEQLDLSEYVLFDQSLALAAAASLRANPFRGVLRWPWRCGRVGIALGWARCSSAANPRDSGMRA